jgi:hypothetical protein
MRTGNHVTGDNQHGIPDLTGKVGNAYYQYRYLVIPGRARGGHSRSAARKHCRSQIFTPRRADVWRAGSKHVGAMRFAPGAATFDATLRLVATRSRRKSPLLKIRVHSRPFAVDTTTSRPFAVSWPIFEVENRCGSE